MSESQAQRGVLTVVHGGELFYRKIGRGYSYIRHTRQDCPHLRQSDVKAVREVDLWRGFVCETCRRRDDREKAA